MGDRPGEGEEKDEQPCSAGPGHGRVGAPAVQVAQDTAQDIWGCTHSHCWVLVRKEGSGGEAWGTEKAPPVWVAVGLSKAPVRSQQAHWRAWLDFKAQVQP